MRTAAFNIHQFVAMFESHPVVKEMAEYKMLARVLDDQCLVKIDGRSWSSVGDFPEEMMATRRLRDPRRR